MPDRAVGAAAQRLGADVPYFLEGGTALGLERGDLLFPLLDLPPAWVVVAVPDFGVSTKAAFSWWDDAAGAGGRERSADGQMAPADELRNYVNDLEAPVAARHPEIARLVRALRLLGATHAAMSGSGSAVFGLFDTRAAAERAGRAAERKVRRVVVAQTLNRSKYQRLAAT